MLRMELEMVRAWVSDRIMQLRDEDGDRGNMTSETVIWIAVIVIAAIAIGAIIVAKITAKANEINLQ
ncbi:MAG TPA: hypothetical protein VIC62_03970 [Nakamurella sp.]